MRGRQMQRAQRHFLVLVFCVLLICIVLEIIGPMTFPHPPAYVPTKTYITSDCEDGRRLGNLMFNYASLIGTARRHNMTAVMTKHFRLYDIFKLTAVQSKNMENTLGTYTIFEEFGKRACAYDLRVKTMTVQNTKLSGYFQSWRYFNDSHDTIKKEFTFKDEIQDKAVKLLAENVPAAFQGSEFVRVGIHVRRGDVLKPFFMDYGYTAPDKKYFDKAMKYFTDKYPKVLFTVCSNGMDWCKENIVGDNVVYVESGHEVVDMAILGQCNHTIMSTGTFGWWGAWLANGTTVYYERWPRPVSRLEYMVTKTDFFPPHWIPME